MKISDLMSGAAVSRRTILRTGALAAGATIAAPYVGRAAPPVLRYAVAGIVGPGETETIVQLDWIKQNVLKHHGKEYTIEVTTARGTPGTASLLASGQADIGTSAFPVLATIIQKNAIPGGVKVIAEIHRDAQPGYASNAYAVLDDSPIKTIADLKGKTVAVNAFGSSVEIILRIALKKAGLDPKNDVRVVELPFASIATALRQKRIDAGSLVMPFQIEEAKRGGLRTLFDGVGVVPPYPVLFQLARKNFLEERGDVAKAWLADYVTAVEWLYDPGNRKKAVELTAGLIKSTPEDLDAWFLTKRDFYREINPCPSASNIQPPIDAMTEFGFLTERVSVKEHIDGSYLPRPCSAA